jgi:hypothetical protein
VLVVNRDLHVVAGNDLPVFGQQPGVRVGARDLAIAAVGKLCQIGRGHPPALAQGGKFLREVLTRGRAYLALLATLPPPPCPPPSRGQAVGLLRGIVFRDAAVQGWFVKGLIEPEKYPGLARLAVFAVSAGNYQRALTNPPQKSWAFGTAGGGKNSEMPAVLPLFFAVLAS